jgi:hypothetical protein
MILEVNETYGNNQKSYFLKSQINLKSKIVNQYSIFKYNNMKFNAMNKM